MTASLPDLCRQLWELLKKVPDYSSMAAEADKHGYYDCPMCDGEGSVDGSMVQRAGSRDKHPVAEAYGVQCFGIGDDHLNLDRLIALALSALPALLEAAERTNALDHLFAGMADPRKEIAALKAHLAAAHVRIAGLTEALQEVVAAFVESGDTYSQMSPAQTCASILRQAKAALAEGAS